jgi:hypothetical protein
MEKEIEGVKSNEGTKIMRKNECKKGKRERKAENEEIGRASCRERV